MNRLIAALLPLFLSCMAAAQRSTAAGKPPAPPRNIVLFIADGLRHDSVTADAAPTMFSLRQQGVDFANSHSLYPTFTTPNASAFATGHMLGDTGDFGNALYIGHPLARDGDGGTLTPFIENDLLLAKLNGFNHGNYLGEKTLSELARDHHYAVAVIGKHGPVAIQDVAEIKIAGNALQPTEAVIIDDGTGPQGVPLSADVLTAMKNAGINSSAPDRSNGQTDPASPGNNGRSGTTSANLLQQKYFANAATQAILPAFQKAGKPFLLIYWSRDPDGSQHNQGDSPDSLEPGINGPTSLAAVRNADNNLLQIVNYLKENHLYENTDILVVSDHGFSTISKKEISSDKTLTKSYAASLNYADVKPGYLPPGFLAIDLAHELKLPLYDPDAKPVVKGGSNFYPPIAECDCPEIKKPLHPSSGNGAIGGSGKIPDKDKNELTDSSILVASNGGSDLIYLPQTLPEKAPANQQLARQICDFLFRQDYVDGVFVRDDLGAIPGALPLSAIGLKGATNLPNPAIVVNFKSFSLHPGSLLSRVEISDASQQEGQGMHGTFSRADTFNTMLAFGPDFKSGYKDRLPASNADIAVTIAGMLHWKTPESNGTLRGRVLNEALKEPSGPSGTAKAATKRALLPAANGARTVLLYQTLGDHQYFDQACIVQKGDRTQTCQ